MFCPKAPTVRASARAFFTTTTALLFACASVRGEAPDKLLQEAMAHDVKLEAREALAGYLELEKQQPENGDILLRIARQYRHLMADSSSPEEKMKLGNLAISYGRRAAAAAPKCSDAQLSCAISYGKMVPMLGSKEQMAASKLIKAGAEKAIKLDAQNDLAWHILGRWHRNVAGVSGLKKALASVVYSKLPDATNEDAVKCLEKAVQLNPNRLMHRVELGRAYAQAGRTEEACKSLETGLSMPCVEKDDTAMKAAAKETLASIR